MQQKKSAQKVFSFLSLALISGTMFLSANLAQAAGWDVSSISDFGLPDNTVMGVVTVILEWLLGMLGIFGILGFLISGVMYLVSAGDDDLIKLAKKAMTFSLIGVIVGMIGLIVINVVYNILNASGNI